MAIKTDDYIILSPTEEIKALIYETFQITRIIYFDPRLETTQIIEKNVEEINLDYFLYFHEKCLKMNEFELIFNVHEFLYIAQTIDFVAKCFIGSVLDKFEKIAFSEEYPNFGFIEYKKWYWTQSTKLFQDFRDTFKDEKLLKRFNCALNYKNEKLLNALMKN